MKIGLDCDDVLADTTVTLAAEYNRRYGTSLTAADLTPEPERWKIIVGEEGVQRCWDIFAEEDVSYHLLPISGAVEGVKRLHQSGAKLYVVTNRIILRPGLTEEWLERWFDQAISGVFYTSSNGYDRRPQKGELCRREGLDRIVEDVDYNIEQLRTAGIKTFVYDQPWNKEVVEDHLVKRVTDWKEISERINHNHYK
ncbi:hypothetical protein HYX14_00780 [Candidatus Woesearchaeota archaeon]|nr:hypothetical protein [Candidatus Woesearchaeota archaeon]